MSNPLLWPTAFRFRVQPDGLHLIDFRLVDGRTLCVALPRSAIATIERGLKDMLAASKPQPDGPWERVRYRIPEPPENGTTWLVAADAKENKVALLFRPHEGMEIDLLLSVSDTTKLIAQTQASLEALQGKPPTVQ